MTTTRESHRYDDCGLPYVVLENMAVSRCAKCGAEMVAVPAIEQLHAFIAVTVASKNTMLVPEEVRFLRKYLGCSGQDFASLAGVTPETVSKWENGRRSISGPAERFLRLLVFKKQPADAYPIEQLKNIDGSKATPVRVEARHGADAWEASGAR